MSFDISFRPANLSKEPSLDDFVKYFAERSHYEYDEEFLEFSYINRNSGACFTFIFDGPMSTQICPEPERGVLSFNVSYSGGSAALKQLAVEAAAEMNQVCSHFDLLYEDRQFSETEGHVPFSERNVLVSLAESGGFADTVIDFVKAQGETTLF
ncbi:MAG: hypothetical protein JST89_04265 [Cyanobacteria bacterium SZAS-4]|nr:hypothetical protein [Cyanobacteria bacterium SZAS-4]